MKIIALAGSLRKESFNKKLIEAVAKLDSSIEVIDISDYPLPLYDGDLEESDGIPENAKKLKAMFMECDAFILSSPEYNSSISGTLKNLIDWISRPEKSDPKSLPAFQGKQAGIISASPGGLGGLRGLFHLRDILMNMGTSVLPKLVTLPSAFSAFNEDGTLKDPKKEEDLKALLKLF